MKYIVSLTYTTVAGGCRQADAIVESDSANHAVGRLIDNINEHGKANPQMAAVTYVEINSRPIDPYFHLINNVAK